MSDTKPSTPEYRAISSLHNWENNPRTATKDGIERLIKQIKKLGVYKPLLITEDGTVLGGNMRLKALEQMGEKKVWVSVVQADTEEKKIEYALSDNDRVGKYEGDQLANLIGNFPEVEWGDYSVDIKEPELVSDLMDSFKEVEEDEVPEVSNEPAISKLGEIYQLGRHRVMCGDSTKIEDVTRLMDGKKADMVFTDPPYGINLNTDYEGMPSRWNNEETYRNKFTKVIGDEKPVDMSFLQSIPCKEMFLWGADYYAYSLPNAGADGTWYVWDKREDDDGKSYDKMLTSPFELCWGKTKRGKKFIRMRWAGFMSSDSAKGERPIGRVHPTQKPVALASWFIERFSEKDWIIQDLFMGAGFTLLACEQTNRICYGMELDPHYVDVIRKRYDNFINRKITAKT